MGMLYILQVTIKGQVLYLEEPRTQDVRGVPTLLQEIIFADQTKDICLTLWDKNVGTVNRDSFYLFKNVSVRSFVNTKSVSCTTQTEMKEIDKFENVVKPTYVDTYRETGTIDQILITSSSTCQACNRKFQEEIKEGEGLIRCQHCRMKQRANEVNQSLHATLNLKTPQKVIKLAMFNSYISTFITNTPDLKSTDPEDIEDYFLQHTGQFTVTYTPENVVKEIKKAQSAAVHDKAQSAAVHDKAQSAAVHDKA